MPSARCGGIDNGCADHREGWRERHADILGRERAGLDLEEAIHRDVVDDDAADVGHGSTHWHGRALGKAEHVAQRGRRLLCGGIPGEIQGAAFSLAQAASMTRKKNTNKRKKREEMTRERIELNLRDKKTPAVTSRGMEVNQKT